MVSPKGAKEIYVDIYNKRILILSSATQIKQFDKLNDLESGMKGLSAAFTVYNHDDGTHFYVMKCEKWDDVNLLHESIHVAHEIMNRVGVPISYENTEAEAYLVEHIYIQAKKKLKLK